MTLHPKFNRDIFQLIAEQIDDSVTWCRFSQANKMCYQICKQLLKHEIHELAYWHAHEFRTRLPCGILHGEVRGEKRINGNRSGSIERVFEHEPPRYRHEWWYTKTYLSGKLHGYYTVSTVMARFEHGEQTTDPFHNNNERRINIGNFPSSLWKNTLVILPEKVSFQEFEQLTLI